jgi:hypothetical protein
MARQRFYPHFSESSDPAWMAAPRPRASDVPRHGALRRPVIEFARTLTDGRTPKLKNSLILTF